MSLVINGTPANISNASAFNITTTLIEDATHVNLRIRADVIVAAVIVATVEKPKGLPDFDFSDILKAFIPGLSITRGGAALYNVSSGSPLVAYLITFTEIWENSGVTYAGTPVNSSTYKYIYAKGDGQAFSLYVMTGITSLFANKTLRNNACKYYTVTPSEMWIATNLFSLPTKFRI